MTHSDSCDNLFVTELLVHANLCIKSSQRWSSLTGGFRTLKHCVKIHQITLCFCGFFLVMVLLFNFALQWVVLKLPGKILPWNIAVLLHAAVSRMVLWQCGNTSGQGQQWAVCHPGVNCFWRGTICLRVACVFSGRTNCSPSRLASSCWHAKEAYI